MATLEEVIIDDELDKELANSSTDDIINRTRLLENDIKVRRIKLSWNGVLTTGHEIRDATSHTRKGPYDGENQG